MEDEPPDHKPNLREIYDSLATEYYSPEHRTVQWLNLLGHLLGINHAFREQARNLDKSLYDLDVLQIGVGSGQYWVLSGLTAWHHNFDRDSLVLDNEGLESRNRLNWGKIVDFDISPAMLEVAKYNYPFRQMLDLYGCKDERLPAQVEGDASKLGEYFDPDSFDIVLAALCDTIPGQEGMFKGALKILKPGGILVTTYPHKELFTVLRRDIYGIDPCVTRFNTQGREVIVPSLTLTPEELTASYSVQGFVDVQTKALRLGALADIAYEQDWPAEYHIADSLTKTAEVVEKYLGEIPILTYGQGRKPLV